MISSLQDHSLNGPKAEILADCQVSHMDTMAQWIDELSALSQAIRKELDYYWGIQDTKQCLYGILVPQVEINVLQHYRTEKKKKEMFIYLKGKHTETKGQRQRKWWEERQWEGVYEREREIQRERIIHSLVDATNILYDQG